MNTYRGISTVISELVIITIAVAIAIGVIGLIMGWFNTYSSTSEGIYIYPDSILVIDKTNDTVYAIIHLMVNYKPSITLSNIYIDNATAQSIIIKETLSGGPVRINGGQVILPDGTECVLKVTFNLDVNNITQDIPGKKEIYIISNIGNLYKAYLSMVYR